MKPFALLFMTAFTMTAHAADLPTPPDAARKLHVVKAPHGAERVDEYYWMRDDTRKDPAMLAYLAAENAYADALMAPLKPLQHKLYDEVVARIKQDDSSVPYRERGYWYYTRFETGQDYPVHARRKGSMDAAEEVLLDVNAMAAGKDYYAVGARDISQDNRMLAYADDSNGRRQYTIRFKDLTTGKTFPDAIPGSSGSMAWADDNKTLFYVENDPETLLTTRVKKHVLGTDSKDDALVYEEADDTYYMGIGRSRDDRYILIMLHSTVSNETRYAPAAHPQGFAVLAPRERDVEYDADHFNDRWVIRTNAPDENGARAKNFKLATAADGSASRKDWKDWIAHDPKVYVEGFELFDGFTAIAERSEGLERVRVLRGATGQTDATSDFVKADESAYSMGLDVNAEPGTPWLRYSYSSMTTPATTFELDTTTGERRMLKQQPVLGGFDSANYVTERVWVPARDGTKVPVSLVYRKGFQRDGSAPLLQYGYGSYGASMDPDFNLGIISLLDRGMVYALAHIRGGQEMGRGWYEDGKLFNKLHTFTDFIDVTRWLVDNKYANGNRVAAMGGSAGGLLMGAITNMAPDDYRVIVSQVPFVDVVTTMLDPTIPLTTNEYDEWGNPENKASYDYMLGYSPYDNLKKRDYPAIFVGTGLWDSQVQYWEPAKYVARLRDLDTGSQPLVFRINMEAGHGGKSGRFRRYRELAEQQAFMLDQLGVPETR